MKGFALTTALLMGIGIGGGALVSAQTAAPPKAAPKPPAAHVHPGAPSGGSGAMCGGMMAGGGMGMGMMGGGGMGPMGMAGADTKVDVKNIDKGVTITITSPDPARVARLQKMAEAMRLMHEANTP